MPAGPSWFRHVDWALVRTGPAVVDDMPVVAWPPADSDAGEWRRWIGDVWADQRVAGAVGAASPALAGAVGEIVLGRPSDPVRVRRVATSLARYLVRMRRRTTPFGLLAGVAGVRFGPVEWRATGGDRVRVRADAGWLAEVVSDLESDPEVLRRLRVITNNLDTVAAGRLVVSWPPSAPGSDPARRAAASVGLTPPVQMVLRSADAPVALTDLLELLATSFPRAPEGAAGTMIAELVRCGVLITDLRPPSTVIDGARHVLDILRSSGIGAAKVHLLQEGRLSTQARAERPMHGLAGEPGPPAAIDLQVGQTVVLPRAVAEEAAAAAEALSRLSTAPGGTVAWRAYHRGFLDRFGAGSVVRLAHLVDPVTGLGLPDHEAATAADPAQQVRDAQLAALAQQAALDGAHEVALDDAELDRLEVKAGGRGPMPHLDLTAEVHADSAASLEAGGFVLAVTGVGRSALATTGRFLDLLSDEDRQWIDTLPSRVEGAVAAQLSVPPHPARMGNVTRVPQVLPSLIPLAEHHGPAAGMVPLSDLAVMADSRRFYLLSLSSRRPVEPVLACAAAWHTLPPLARLLAQLPHALDGTPGLFDWAAAAVLPLRPRLRYGRAVLSAARWRIPISALPGPAAGSAQWSDEVERLRGRLRLPAWVSVGRADQQLRLHLDDPMDLALLRAHIDAAGRSADREAVVLTEAAGPDQLGWCGGRAHEVVFPLIATAAPTPAPPVLRRRGPLPLIDRDHGYLPGSSVLSAKLYGAEDGFDLLLREYLPELLAAWDTPPVWWFVRYHDPAPHLRVRIRTDAYGRDIERFGAWAARLRAAGLAGDLTLETYRPETARYGAGPAMTAAEKLFAADSAAALAQLTTIAAYGAPRDAVTAVSLLDLAAGLLGDTAAAHKWFLTAAATGDLAGRAGPHNRAALTETLRLAAEPDPVGLGEAWRSRRAAAGRYAAAAAAADRRADTVAVSLLHLHHNRAHGTDAGAEARTHKLARALVLAHRARHRPTGADRP